MNFHQAYHWVPRLVCVCVCACVPACLRACVPACVPVGGCVDDWEYGCGQVGVNHISRATVITRHCRASNLPGVIHIPGDVSVHARYM